VNIRRPRPAAVRLCPVCAYRLDPVLATIGLDRHPGCELAAVASLTEWRRTRRDRSTVHCAPPVRGTAGGGVESGEKAEPPRDELEGSAGRHDHTVTPTPGVQSKAPSVESPNRRESAP
jgi:hypothetical protein